MRVMNITKCDLLNGEGCRVVLWVSHCEHKCKGCQNAYCWDGRIGEKFNDSHVEELYKELKNPYISGITFTGGDPLSSINYKEIINLSKQIKRDFPTKTQWLWTGYTLEEILQSPRKEILKTVDVLCDGKFEIDKLSPNKRWVGSSNQRVIDVRKTMEEDKIVLYEDD